MDVATAMPDLKAALARDGCPICFLSRQAEQRYLRYLVREGPNDSAALTLLAQSLGLCREHAWAMGRLEPELYGGSLATSIICRNLVQEVEARLQGYIERLSSWRTPGWRRLLHLPAHPPPPRELVPDGGCRVCQMGESAARAYSAWLLAALSGPQASLREQYGHPASLCLPHLCLALGSVGSETIGAALFLARESAARLAALDHNLGEYGDKHAWERRSELVGVAEEDSVRQALAFLSGDDGTDGRGA